MASSEQEAKWRQRQKHEEALRKHGEEVKRKMLADFARKEEKAKAELFKNWMRVEKSYWEREPQCRLITLESKCKSAGCEWIPGLMGVADSKCTLPEREEVEHFEVPTDEEIVEALGLKYRDDDVTFNSEAEAKMYADYLGIIEPDEKITVYPSGLVHRDRWWEKPV